MTTNEIEDRLARLADDLHGIVGQLNLDERSIIVRLASREYGRQEARDGQARADVGLLLMMLNIERAKLRCAEKDNIRLKNRIVMLCPCCEHRIVYTPENCECVEDCPNAS